MFASSQTPEGAQPPQLVRVEAGQAAGMTRSYDGLAVEAIAEQAKAQAYAEFRADLATAVQAGTEIEDRQTLAWFHERARAVAQLCDGRPDNHLLTVYEVEAALNGAAPTQMPLTMAWDGQITEPDGDGPGEATLIPCITSRGGNAVVALSPEERLVLGAQLLATLHAAETCTRSGCGTPAEDLDDSDPKLLGWIAVDIAGAEGGPRWWCSPMCVAAAIAAAAAELAAVDQADAGDPDEQAPDQLYGGDLAAWVADAHDNEADRDADARATQGDPEYLDAQYGIGASDEYALQVAEAHEAAVEDERGDVEDGAR